MEATGKTPSAVTSCIFLSSQPPPALFSCFDTSSNTNAVAYLLLPVLFMLQKKRRQRKRINYLKHPSMLPAPYHQHPIQHSPPRPFKTLRPPPTSLSPPGPHLRLVAPPSPKPPLRPSSLAQLPFASPLLPEGGGSYPPLPCGSASDHKQRSKRGSRTPWACAQEWRK